VKKKKADRLQQDSKFGRKEQYRDTIQSCSTYKNKRGREGRRKQGRKEGK
jgi:hypothetical protein